MPRSLAQHSCLRLDQLRRENAMHRFEQCVAAHQIKVSTQLCDAAGTAAPVVPRPAYPHRRADKVQTFDGRWLSIDGRILFKAVNRQGGQFP
jgi:hypothetical protein